MAEHRSVDVVIRECCGVLFQADLRQPVRYLLRRWRAHDNNSSSSFLASFRSSVSKPSVNEAWTGASRSRAYPLALIAPEPCHLFDHLVGLHEH
jgi:hypothetical protein